MSNVSILPEIEWPAIPAASAARLLAMLFQFERTEQWPLEKLRAHQLRQVSRVVEHASRTVPFYQSRYGDVPHPKIESWRDFEALPINRRSEVQAAGPTIHSSAPPRGHGAIGESYTSGSTGQPIKSLSTGVTRELWRAFTLRDHFWHERDFSATLAVIRDTSSLDANPPNGKWVANWGKATQGVINTGPAVLLNVRASVSEQAQWLIRGQPTYLLAYPSVARALADFFRQNELQLPSLREIRTFGEIVEPTCREAVRRTWNVPIVDVYSCQELGYIALQCPISGQYHVQSENVIVEVLSEDGQPCRAGEVGRVVVTTLHNFAMPLIRYDLGDYAELGAGCPCGRGLPVLKQVLGRQRNMLLLPNGQKRWPSFGHGDGNLPPFQQFQLVQRSLSQLDLRIVRDSPLSAEEEQLLVAHLQRELDCSFQIRVVRVDQIAREPSGKYEEFRNEIDTIESEMSSEPSQSWSHKDESCRKPHPCTR